MASIQDLSKDFFQALPDDILMYILPFTYKAQNTDLLEDLRNFVETKNDIFHIYNYKCKHLLKYEINADKHWLISDLLLFQKINRSNKDIYKKMVYLINEYLFLKKNIHFQFNKLWTMFSPFKRTLFIKIRSFPKKK